MRHRGVRRAIVSIISFGVSGDLVCHLCTINRCFFLLTDNNRLCSLYLPCCVGTFGLAHFHSVVLAGHVNTQAIHLKQVTHTVTQWHHCSK